LGPKRGDWYLRVLIGVLTGQEVTEAGFPMPWERAVKLQKKPLSREEIRAQVRASREALAEEIAHTKVETGVR